MKVLARLLGFFLLVAVAWTPAGAAEPQLGRLFFTPQQRAALDAGRRIFAAKKSDDHPRPARQSRRPREIELNGIVMRSDGERTVWVNGKSYYRGSPRGLEILTDPGRPASARIRLPGKKTTDLRVGQRLEAGSGEVHEKYLGASAGPQPRSRAQRAERRSGSASVARPKTAPGVDENGETTRAAPAR
ncbi:MAG TPA: hypothetical protein VNM24_08275 [Burkholderiales bacterium]|jgi:hypothetical protein|nr:hypothetical protein [Burkholderiales bacterium]